jgi:hypothetical protein
MAKFLTTAAVILGVENIIENANKKLVLISPFVQISKILLERLQQASQRGVEIILIYGKGELKTTEKKQFETIENLTLYFYENLHAKCYFNEKEMVITSMNLYEFSEKHNREMGVLIKKTEDKELFEDTVKETHSIIKAASTSGKNNSTITKSSAELVPAKNIFPLLEHDFKVLHEHFDNLSNHSKVNSTESYVYCEKLLGFADVMIREGFELRFLHNVTNERLILKKLRELNLSNLNYNYDCQLIEDKNSNYRILILCNNASNLNCLCEDYEKIYNRIVDITDRISYRTRPVW